MKKLALFSMMALVMLFSQCKKEETPANSEKTINISITAICGGEKTGFNDNAFTWSSETEYVYVGGDQHDDCLGCIQSLSHNGGQSAIGFSGEITEPNVGENLYFFYLGQGDEERTGTSLNTVDFSDQDGGQGDVTKCHIAISEAVPYTGAAAFASLDDPIRMHTKMSIAFVNLAGFGSETVYVHGEDIYSSATVSYKTGEINVTDANKGFIKMNPSPSGQSSATYVALLPMPNSESMGETVVVFESATRRAEMTFKNGIEENVLYSNTYDENLGEALVLNIQDVGLFSVSLTKMVKFSQGNLQYKPSTSTWRFAEHQYDMCVGVEDLEYWVKDDYYGQWYQIDEATYHAALYHPTISMNDAYAGGWFSKYDISSQYVAGGSSWIDLFGWGTWGPEKTPYSVSTTNSSYTWSGDFSGTISNSGLSTWRTLTMDEWTYLLDGRSNARSLSGLGTVCNVHGLIVLPDVFTDPCANFQSFVYDNEDERWVGSWDDNVYTSENWALMESAGAVFLPAAGRRTKDNDFTTLTDVIDVGDWGAYWSSTPANSSTSSYGMFIIDGNRLWLGDYGDANRSDGSSVRLVRDVN